MNRKGVKTGERGGTCRSAERESGREMTAYIWDLDGTLLNSYDVIVAAAARTAAEAGVHDEPDSVLRAVKQGSVGSYLRDAALRGGESFERLLQRYRELTHRDDGRIRLTDGAKETLEQLSRSGAVHFVFTHRGPSSGPILRRLGILDCFREVVTSVYGFAPKPSGEGVRYLLDRYALDPEKTWYVGDRSLDVLCAKDAGVKALLYLPEGACVAPTGKEDRIVRDLREMAESGSENDEDE